MTTSTWAAAVLAGACAIAAAADPKEKPAKGVTVKTVLDVKYAIQQSEPPKLVVTATGEVPTAGWTGAKLTRRVYVTPPAAGVYEYDLTAVPPDRLVAQVISKVTAAETGPVPAGIKGVKVYGVGAGAKTVLFDKKDK